MDFQNVVKVYNQTNSMRKTACRCNISTGKVRKILVTCNAYDSTLYRQISRMQNAGKNIKEIAEMLGKSTQCIVSYVPYSRGERTGMSQTPNAIKIRKCRAKKKGNCTRGYQQ